MKILILTHYWRPHIGGIETVAREQAVRLRRRGHAVTVLTSRLRGDPRVMDDDGVTVRRITAVNPFESRAVPYPIFSPGLWRTMRREVTRHDVVLAHGHTYMPTVVAARLTRRLGRPLILLQHNPLISYRAPWREMQTAADATLGRYSFKHAQTVGAVSEHTAAYIRSLSRRRVHIIRSGVDVERFAPCVSGDERRALRRAFGLPDDRFVVLTVRRLTFRNGVDVLAEAAAELRGEPIEFAIGGDGPQRADIEARALSNVRLLGAVAEERLADLYRSADAFVLPTRTGEGFGLVLLEAAASGLPVIATRAGAQDEVVNDGSTGILVAPESPHELSKAIGVLVADPAGAAAMGVEGRKLALTQSWDATVTKLEEVLTEAVEGTR
jgi:glycosyltransferase involved in cell wall biosynthesis